MPLIWDRSVCFAFIQMLLSSLVDSLPWTHANMVIASFVHSPSLQYMWSLPQWCGDKETKRCFVASLSFFCVWSYHLLEALCYKPMGVSNLLLSATCLIPLSLRGSLILPRMNSGEQKQQERDEPGGDLLTLRRVITSLGLSYANAFISKSTVII